MTNAALAMKDENKEEKIISVVFVNAIKREKAKRKRKSLNDIISSHYYNSYKEDFDKNNVIAQISDLFYKRGYSFEKRMNKIEDLIGQHQVEFTEQEEKYVQEILGIADNYVGKKIGTRREIRNYSAVRDKINNLMSNIGKRNLLPIAFTENPSASYNELEIKVSKPEADSWLKEWFDEYWNRFDVRIETKKDSVHERLYPSSPEVFSKHYNLTDREKYSPPVVKWGGDSVVPDKSELEKNAKKRVILGYFPRLLKRSLAYAAAITLMFFGTHQSNNIDKTSKEKEIAYQTMQNR
jgi:hypothetical protein